MRQLTKEEVNKLEELIKKQFPEEIEVEWEYDSSKTAQFLNFTIIEK